MARTAEVRKKVRFEVQAESGKQVHVAGTFNSWDPKGYRLIEKEGVYTGTFMVPVGRHEYKFVIEDVWCIDCNNPEWVPNTVGSLNSVVVVA